MNIALMDDVQDKTHAHHVRARKGHSPWWERSLYQTEGSMPQEWGLCVRLQIARLALAIKLRLEYSACVGELQQARM